MAIKFDWSKYRSEHPKLPDVKEQWKRIINAEKGVTREAIQANRVEQARIQGQKEGLRIIGEEVAPFTRYVIRNPKGELVGFANDQVQLEEQLSNLNITPNAFDPKGFNAQGKQVIGKYRIYDNDIRGPQKEILEIAHPKAVPLHKRINVPLLINERILAETETRASSVPPDEKRIEEWIEEMKKEEKKPIKISSGVKPIRTVEYVGGKANFYPINKKDAVARMPRGTEYTTMPDYSGYYIIYDPTRKIGKYTIREGLGGGKSLLDASGYYIYSDDLGEIIERGKEVIKRRMKGEKTEE